MTYCGVTWTIFLDKQQNAWLCGELEGKRMEMPKQLSSLQSVAEISCGYSHVIYVSTFGSVHGFGSNKFGQLGFYDGSQNISHTEIHSNFVPKMGDSSFISVSCGGYHTLCLDNNSNLWGFGRGSHGQMGVSTETNIILPSVIAKNVVFFVGGPYTTMYCNNDGDCFSCGENNCSELGIKDEAARNVLEFKPCFTNYLVKKLGAGYKYSIALTEEGKVIFAGPSSMVNADQHVFNRGTYDLELNDIISISTGYRYFICMDHSGQLFFYGDLNGEVIEKVKRIGSKRNICYLSNSSTHTYVLDGASNLYLLGSNLNGQFGQKENTIVTKVPRDFSEKIAIPGVSSKAKSARK